MKRLYQYGAFAVLFVTLAACAGMFVKDETTNESIAAGYVLTTGTREAATELLNAHSISSADARNVQRDADLSREGLKIAEDLAAVNPDAADAKAQQVLIGLRALDSYLKSRRGAVLAKPPGEQP